MKIYNTHSGILVEHEAKFYLLPHDNWDEFINDDDIIKNTKTKLTKEKSIKDAASIIENGVKAPVQSQEIWASGVTYYNSKLGREEESKEAGGSSFYARVYEADRPELFFKATPQRTVGQGGVVRIRKDSTWNVPEPELTLVITSSGKIVGYTIGNDMSSRSIEGENPLYLPQAKTYDGCAAIGPCVLLIDGPLPNETKIRLVIKRKGVTVFDKNIGIDQIKRKFGDLVEYLYRECTFPNGSLLMTGTGIIPPGDFTLSMGDEIEISIEGIGTLKSTVG
ncbi:fumarylacetoacetate hydrolase family protein [Maribacter hydrothermalis]|uniref:2-hydroxyhepta-2,4-diene-1,7-dioate isomerase n=1 Tax=Maribacter hydrothermalis TaxID=1836467 RepID=A0A1B7Z484_9FLAO|nr:fumarylacetoacetate hydrolase family protein [Maribacter hydrothermalis]APQ17245.1 2-hydroxyhepta-2,4-diene-1,7-dioate isomerase [Maribacter hydrothermalis]OBR37504.1 2-hydroxyhepta-2,4-diene-1,7-dioate isomerase [Maribacter hydrothermalis]